LKEITCFGSSEACIIVHIIAESFVAQYSHHGTGKPIEVFLMFEGCNVVGDGARAFFVHVPTFNH